MKELSYYYGNNRITSLIVIGFRIVHTFDISTYKTRICLDHISYKVTFLTLNPSFILIFHYSMKICMKIRRLVIKNLLSRVF